MKTEFVITLFDDEVTKGKLKLLSRLEAAFDDERNKLPEGFFWFSDELPLGGSVKITLEFIK